MGVCTFYKNSNYKKEIEINIEMHYEIIINRFKDIQKSIALYSKDIEEKIILIQDFQSFLNKINADLNKNLDTMNISIVDNYKKENKINDSFDVEKSLKLKDLSGKVNDFKNIIENIKSITLKKVENIYEFIQNNLNDDKYYGELYAKLNELEEINKNLENKQVIYNTKKEEIEKDIEEIQTIVKKFVKNSETIFDIAKESLKLNSDEIKISTRFLKNSMLLDIKEYQNSDKIFKSSNLFKEDDNNENQECQNLLKKNWDEKCYIYDEYDLHDINYELKAVGLPPNVYYSSSSFSFYIGILVEIIEFEIDGKKTDYKFEEYSLKFKINLYNLESNKIHLKYKEKPPTSKKIEEDNIERKLYRSKYYGLTNDIKGQKAKFSLIIICDFEVISFDELFLVKKKDKEYTWEGEVPPEGKRTIVNLSKSEGKFNFEVINRIENKDNKPFENTKITVPFLFQGGNNEILKIKYSDNIEIKNESKQYEINFNNIKETYGEFLLEGELKNKCKGEWICDLTDEEIEKHTPEEYKKNKEIFRERAEQIIKNYNEIHKDEKIEVTDIAKIGKWVHENIKYDINYKGKNHITANEIFNNKVGVCHHFTKLFNAFMYSLGFKCVYVYGYAIEKKDYFSSENEHAWSLIKINGKWLPFDATCGIFTGKLPICHIFYCYFSKGVKKNENDSAYIMNTETRGKFF